MDPVYRGTKWGSERVMWFVDLNLVVTCGELERRRDLPYREWELIFYSLRCIRGWLFQKQGGRGLSSCTQHLCHCSFFWGKTKQDFSPIKVCPAASIIPKADSSHSYPEAAPGLCISYFPSLSHNTQPKRLEEGNIYYGSDFKSEPIITRKVQHRSLQWLAILHPKAESRGRWDYGPWDRTAHCEGVFWAQLTRSRLVLRGGCWGNLDLIRLTINIKLYKVEIMKNVAFKTEELKLF